MHNQDNSSKNSVPGRNWEQIDVSIYKPKTSRIVFKVLLFVLIGIIVLSVLAACLTHPLDKLSIRLLLSESYIIDIYSYGNYQSDNQRIYVDGNRIKYFDGKRDHYYEIEGDTLYYYTKTADGQWKKTVESQLTDSSDQNILSALLDKKNYQKVKGEPGVYETKPGVKLRGAKKVKYTRGYETGRFGYYDRFIMNYKDSQTEITVCKIGNTKVTFPWEK